MQEYNIGVFKLQFNSETNVNIITLGKCQCFDDVVYSEWRNSKGITIWDNSGNGEYYITVPLYSSISVYVRNMSISDSLTTIVEGAIISERALDSLLGYGFLCAPETLFEGVFKLPRWTYMKIRMCDANVSFCPIKILGRNRNGLSLQDEYNSLMDNLPIRVLDDYELTLAFSGGLDSAVLHAMLKFKKVPHGLYNVGVIGGRDESEYQRKCLNNNENIVKSIMTETDAENAFERHIQRCELFGSSIALKYEFMYKDISTRGYKSVLTGDGPDDLLLCSATKDEFISEDGRVINAFWDCSKKKFPYFSTNSPNVLGIWYAYNYIIAPETNIYFEHLIASQNKVRLQTPYLDSCLLDFCANRSKEIYETSEKQLLKGYASKKVPIEIIEREKKGFTSDVAVWFAPGKVFYEKSTMLSKTRFHTAYANMLADRISSLLEEYSAQNYNPQSRTNGNGGINSLYTTMLILSWIQNIQKNNMYGVNIN